MVAQRNFCLRQSESDPHRPAVTVV